eukprot:1048978-Pleurochrysis_carterae.AAC.1
MANTAKSSAPAAVAESPNLPLRTPRSTPHILSISSSLTPILFCSTVASFRLLSSIAAVSGPCNTPYEVSDSRCVSALPLLPPFFDSSVATARGK